MTDGDTQTQKNRREKSWLAPRTPMLAACLLLLAFVAAESWSRPSPADAAPYHAEIRRVADVVPMDIAGWKGADAPVPPSAVKLLRPNVLVSRTYQHQRTGQHAAVLLVQCKDAADLVGHYPPRCYPAHGWSVVESTAHDWRIGGRNIPGMAYRYSMVRNDTTINLHVINFLLLPDGTLSRDMGDVAGAAADYTRFIYGAAQLQVVTDAELSESERNDILKDLLPAYFPLMDAIGGGVDFSVDPTVSIEPNGASRP